MRLALNRRPGDRQTAGCTGHRIPGFNFKWGHRVIPDPLHRDEVYITTFGGSVWHGAIDGQQRRLDIATPVLDPGQ